MKYLYLIAILFLTSACASMDAKTAAIHLGVGFATASFIQDSEDPAAKAVRVNDLAKGAKLLIETGEIALPADLRDKIKARISWQKLTTQEALLAAALLDQITGVIERQLQSREITPDTRIKVASILDAVITYSGG